MAQANLIKWNSAEFVPNGLCRLKISGEYASDIFQTPPSASSLSIQCPPILRRSASYVRYSVSCRRPGHIKSEAFQLEVEGGYRGLHNPIASRESDFRGISPPIL
jgi:hypothetical protein